MLTYDTGLVPSKQPGAISQRRRVIDGGVRNLLCSRPMSALSLPLTTFAGFFPEWITFTVFLIMIVLIIVRPQGILG